ncbi:MAG: GNAT family N-acetyltransferase [Gammaproteobacteria bacterium]
MKNSSVPFSVPFSPVTLEGRRVRLEPLSLAHLPALQAAGAHDELWPYFVWSFAAPEAMKRFVETALADQQAGTALPFAIIEVATGETVGSTRFGAIDRHHRRAECGWTWLTPARQRGPLNTEMKYLMLRHAFEVLGWLRVEFKTDALNAKSRRALERIGATQEGIFRNHMVMHTGKIRDSVWFSVIDRDWPRVKRQLEQLMAVGRHAHAAGSVGK